MIHALTVFRLTDEAGAEVLSRLLDTGRARWLTLDGPTLRAGPARQGNLSWVEAGAGALLPQLTVDGAGTVLAATPPVYVDPAAGLLGPVETGQPARVAAALLQAPSIAATALAALNEKAGATGARARRPHAPDPHGRAEDRREARAEPAPVHRPAAR